MKNLLFLQTSSLAHHHIIAYVFPFQANTAVIFALLNRLEAKTWRKSQREAEKGYQAHHLNHSLQLVKISEARSTPTMKPRFTSYTDVVERTSQNKIALSCILCLFFFLFLVKCEEKIL
jgi:hypothetical protein